MEKKYILTDQSIEYLGRTLYRIKALRDFGAIKAGNLGGFIQNESNLSHDGNCWVFDNAKVFGNACISDNANVYNDACVFDDAKVYDNSDVSDNAMVYDNTKIYDNACISDNASVYNNAKVYDNASVYNDAKVSGNACIFVNSWVNFNVDKNADFVTLGHFGNKNRSITISTKQDIINCGCFSGTLEQFKKAVDKKYKGKGNYYTAIKMIETLRI